MPKWEFRVKPFLPAINMLKTSNFWVILLKELIYFLKQKSWNVLLVSWSLINFLNKYIPGLLKIWKMLFVKLGNNAINSWGNLKISKRIEKSDQKKNLSKRTRSILKMYLILGWRTSSAIYKCHECYYTIYYYTNK